jgi:hypothetical protein
MSPRACFAGWRRIHGPVQPSPESDLEKPRLKTAPDQPQKMAFERVTIRSVRNGG